MRWDADKAAGRRRGPGRRIASALVALAFSVPLAGCGLFSSGVTVTAPAEMTVSESLFPGNVMPPRFTCDGSYSPPISWAGAPQGTKSIALVVDDGDAPITPYVYWLVFNIGPGTSAILSNHVPPDSLVARGSAGFDHYNAPCPGPGGHDYRFTVYALNTVLHLPPGTSLQSAWQAIAAATIGRGRLSVSAVS